MTFGNLLFAWKAWIHSLPLDYRHITAALWSASGSTELWIPFPRLLTFKQTTIMSSTRIQIAVHGSVYAEFIAEPTIAVREADE